MKVAPVDRYGGWRTGSAGAEPRVSAALRLKAAEPDAAAHASAPTLASERELPVLAVKDTVQVVSRPVLSSDRPRDVDAALHVFSHFQSQAGGATVVSSEARAPNAASGTPGSKGPKGAKGSDPANDQVSPSAESVKPGHAEGASPKGPAGLSTEAANAVFGNVQEEAAKAALEAQQQAQAEVRQVKQEPISKVLIDLVHNVWEASRSVVDANSAASGAVGVHDIPKPMANGKAAGKGASHAQPASGELAQPHKRVNA